MVIILDSVPADVQRRGALEAHCVTVGSLHGTSPAKGVAGLAEATQLGGRPPGRGFSQAPSRVRWNTSELCEGLCLFPHEGRWA